MDYACPHCSSSLKRVKVLPPVPQGSAIIAGDALLCCPCCNGGLLLNQHADDWSLPIFGFAYELAAYAVVGLALIVVVALYEWVPVWFSFFATVISCTTAFVWSHYRFKNVTLAQWPRYRPASFSYIEQRGFPN